MKQPWHRVVVVTLAMATGIAGCGLLTPYDPDDGLRDRMVATARGLIEAVELPPGYVAVPWDETWHHPQIVGFQTPGESKQLNGDAHRYFRPLVPTTSAQALADFDGWFQAHGYVPAVYARSRPQCEPALASATWARPNHLVELRYSSGPGRESTVNIPGSYLAIPGASSPNVELTVPPTVCT
jgi:hypothetical protein